MSGLAEVIAHRHEVVKAVLGLLLAEQNLSDEETSTQAVMGAEERLTLTARDLTRAVDRLPAGRQPEGWQDGGYRAITGTVGGILLDPDCRDGKHRSCAGSPCECTCHLEDVPGVAA